jgi:hypothetical protein
MRAMAARFNVLGTLGLLLMASCSSHALRGRPVDAAGTGGTATGGASDAVDAWLAPVGGQLATGGRSATGGESAAGGGVGGASSSRDAAAVPDVHMPADASLPRDLAGEPADAAAPADAPTAPDLAEAGEAGSPLAAFCVGSESKIAYGGQSFVVPVTTKAAYPIRDCCMDYEARLHSTAAIGEDLDVVVRLPFSLRAGTYDAEEPGLEATLHRSWELPYVERPMDSRLRGRVVVEDVSSDPAQPWHLGLCVSVDERSARWPGMQIYVTGVRVAPAGWASRFRIWRLEDASLTGQDVVGLDIQALKLAAVPLLRLTDFDFVRFAAKSCGPWATPCTWMELNTDYVRGSELRSRLGSRVDLRGIPFVVEADGERIYVGAFQTGISSIGFPGPGVMVEDMVDSGFAVYPPPNFRPLPPDGRQDARIVKVFTEAGKVAP